MKKSLIVTGAASLALAAMPVVGVFAEAPEVVDTITVKIAESCSFQATQGTGAGSELNPDSDNEFKRTFEKSVELGQSVILGDPSQTDGSGKKPASDPDIVIEGVCNTGDSSSASTGSAGTWSITAKGSGTTASLTGPGDAIESTSAKANLDSGTVSGWGMKVDSSATTWSVVPGSAGGVVASGNAAGTSFSFAPSYRVYVGTEQAAGTYSGTVTYTIAYTAPQP